MTNEEAIEFLKYAMENPNPNGNLTDEHTQIVLQVINLAIKALEEQRSQGDLISREALRKVFSDWHNWHTVIGYGKVVFLDKLLEEIDNAPTVVNEYTKGFADGERSGRNFPLTDEEKAILVRQWRPQGEWVRYRDNPHQPEHIKCSNCGQYWSVADHDKIFDICFKCGADMRKGDED